MSNSESTDLSGVQGEVIDISARGQDVLLEFGRWRLEISDSVILDDQPIGLMQVGIFPFLTEVTSLTVDQYSKLTVNCQDKQPHLTTPDRVFSFTADDWQLTD